MSQSTSDCLHAAIIMDGNGRWASTRGLPRVAGHRAGAEALRRTVEAAPDLGISVLTVYAFSSDNWRRPQPEVSALMKMFHTYLRREQARCVEKGVRVSVIGRRDRLPRLLLPVIDECESATAQGGKLHLRLAVDYSSRDAILAAAQSLNGNATPGGAFGSARRPGCRSADPHRRRTAPERFHALGMRLRRAGIHSGDVAGLRRFRSRYGRQRIPLPRAPLRSAAPRGVGVRAAAAIMDCNSFGGGWAATSQNALRLRWLRYEFKFGRGKGGDHRLLRLRCGVEVPSDVFKPRRPDRRESSRRRLDLWISHGSKRLCTGLGPL